MYPHNPHISTAPPAHVGHVGAVHESPLHRAVAYVRWHERKIALTVVAVVAATIGLQLAYPTDRMLPFAAIASQNIGLKSQQDIQRTLTRLNQQNISIKAAKESYKPSLEEMGIEFDTATSAQAITQYPLSARLVPFSFLFYGRNQDTESLVVSSIDDQAMRNFAEKIAADNTYPAVEGSVYVRDAKVVVDAPKDGAAYSVDDVLLSLKSIGTRTPEAVVLPAATVKPEISAATINKAAAQAKAVIDQPLKLVAAGKEHQVSSATIASWVVFEPNPATASVDIQYDMAAIKLEISSFARQVNEAAGATIITTVDSNEVSRTPGTEGKYLDADKAAATIVEGLRSEAAVIELSLDPLLPGVAYRRSYTSTSAGLQALISEWSKDHPWVQLAVSFKEIGGQKRQANYNSNKQFMAASMYKLYIAHYLLYQIQTGQLQGSTHLGIAQSVDSCLEAMIIVSANHCPIANADAVGWGTINTFTHDSGYRNTQIAASNNLITAGDTANFLTDLYRGDLLDATHTDRFLGMLKRQKYRSAIPKGSRGSVVADKVGIYGSYWHDGGIVYHPKTTYALVILTKGGGSANIADLAGKIYDVVNQ